MVARTEDEGTEKEAVMAGLDPAIHVFLSHSL
jgi:hypothetical protein